MSHLKSLLPLALSFALFACGGEESSTPTPGGGSETNPPAQGDQDSPGGVADDIGKKVGDLGEQAEGVAEKAIEEANSLIEKITAYLGEDKLDLAKTAFAKLESLTDQLPASYQAQIEKIRSLIDAQGAGDKANKLINDLGGFGKD